MAELIFWENEVSSPPYIPPPPSLPHKLGLIIDREAVNTLSTSEDTGEEKRKYLKHRGNEKETSTNILPV